MKSGRASRTAAQNGLFRALESRGSKAERLLDDDLVAGLLPGHYRLVDGLGRIGWVRRRIVGAIDARWPGVRTSVVARTLLIDDLIDQSIGESADIVQVVVLGAGLDTRTQRSTRLADVAVYEVDHPATQRVKRRALQRLRSRPREPVFVAHDFRSGQLDAALADAGYGADRPSLIIWEGVTNYLSADEVDQTLRWCSQAAPGSQLIVTYIDERVLREPSSYHGADRALSTVRRAGEEMTFGLAPADLADHLAVRGLTLRSDSSAAEYRAAYYGSAADSMQGHEFYHVAHAAVAGTG